MRPAPSLFSTPWKTAPQIFHTVENFCPNLPHCGKLFSTLWKISILPLLLGLLPVPALAALPEPPSLPFPLPAATLRIRQTSTVFAPGNYLHLATLDRPLAPYELTDLAVLLADRGWTPRLTRSVDEAAVLQQLRALAPTLELQQPFEGALQMLATGMQSWTLDAIQLIYAPGENATLGISFPLADEDLPSHPGAFTADLSLPLHDARFSQAAIQADDDQITRLETWLSQTPPELFLSQTEPLLIAAGWVPPIPAAAPPTHPENQASAAPVLAMENLFKNVFRVYHRGNAQLSVLRAPAALDDPSAFPHAYTLILRTLLQFPSIPNAGNNP